MKRPGYDALKAYFNLDNGSGKVRGIYAEGNAAAVPLLREWLSPFGSMGADAVVASKTGGTDHVFMQAVGMQGFQFIQDPLDYESRVHHSSIDTLDHMRGDDLRQAAVDHGGDAAGRRQQRQGTAAAAAADPADCDAIRSNTTIPSRSEELDLATDGNAGGCGSFSVATLSLYRQVYYAYSND